jgi:hypothetical protein
MLQFQNEDVYTGGIRGIRDGGSWGGSLLFYTHNTTAGNTFNSTFVERMRIDSTGTLTINSTYFVPLKINTSYGQVGLEFQLNGTGFGGVGSANNFSSDVGILATDVGMGTNGSATSKLAFATGAGYSTRMVVLSNGNVGIATTTPGYTLDVNGNCAATRYYVTTGGNATDPMIRDKTYTSTGIYFPSANAMAITNNGAQSVLFQADGITKVSHLRTSTLYSEFSINLSGTYTNGTYYKICDSLELTSGGIYMIVAYVDTYAAGGGIYFCTFASVPFYWFAGGSNSGSMQTLPTMYGTGHHNLNPPIVRIRLTTVASDGGKQYLEFDPNANWSGINGTGGATVTFYVKRIGS